MNNEKPQNSTTEPGGPGDQPERTPQDQPRPREIGGRKGPEPTRYGDWEKGGRCVDF